MRQTSRENDRRYIRRYLAGKPDAVEEIARWIDAELSACAVRRHADREDLRQAVHQKLLRNLRNNAYRQDASLRRYVSRIARFTTVDHYRRNRMVVSLANLEEAADPQTPYSLLERRERKALLRIALAQCPAGCREMWQMVARQRLSYEQVARRLGIPVGTVKSRMWHCRRRLIRGIQRAAAASAKAAATKSVPAGYAVRNLRTRSRQGAVAFSRLRLPK